MPLTHTEPAANTVPRTGLGWDEVLRAQGGTRLRVELMLSPAVREAMTPASRRAGRWLEVLDGAVLHIEHSSAERCVLRLQAGPLSARLSTLPAQAGAHALTAHLDGVAQVLPAEVAEVWLQRGSDSDMYLACEVEGARLPLLRLRHASDCAPAFSLAIFSAAWSPRLPPALRAWLPAQMDLATFIAEAAP
jgi:hypothetical protein